MTGGGRCDEVEFLGIALNVDSQFFVLSRLGQISKDSFRLSRPLLPFVPSRPVPTFPQSASIP